MISAEKMREKYNENGINKDDINFIMSRIDQELREESPLTRKLVIKDGLVVKADRIIQDEVARQMRELGYNVEIERGMQYNEPYCIWTIKW